MTISIGIEIPPLIPDLHFHPGMVICHKFEYEKLLNKVRTNYPCLKTCSIGYVCKQMGQFATGTQFIVTDPVRIVSEWIFPKY